MWQEATPGARTFVYILNDNIISGARYHLVATYSVIIPTSFPPSVPDALTLLARPKSHTFRSQLAFTRRLAGFRSLCTMPALWMDLRARTAWYTKYCRITSISRLSRLETLSAVSPGSGHRSVSVCELRGVSPFASVLG
jgi:hypothetical protein